LANRVNVASAAKFLRAAGGILAAGARGAQRLLPFLMRKPNVSRPRSAAAAFSLSRKLPKLRLPASAAARTAPRLKPQVGRPAHGTSIAMPTASATHEPVCNRCEHGESQHPVRYVCDKYPHPDPLRICGCESEHLEEICSKCGHKARRHKARHRCRAADCRCWGFDGA